MSVIEIRVSTVPDFEVLYEKLSAHTGLELVMHKPTSTLNCGTIGTPDWMSDFELEYVNDYMIRMASTGLHSYLCIAALQVLIDLGVTTADNIPIKIPKWSRQRWADRKWWQFIKL